jgi:hypothetical protein
MRQQPGNEPWQTTWTARVGNFAALSSVPICGNLVIMSGRKPMRAEPIGIAFFLALIFAARYGLIASIRSIACRTNS